MITTQSFRRTKVLKRLAAQQLSSTLPSTIMKGIEGKDQVHFMLRFMWNFVCRNIKVTPDETDKTSLTAWQDIPSSNHATRDHTFHTFISLLQKDNQTSTRETRFHASLFT